MWSVSIFTFCIWQWVFSKAVFSIVNVRTMCCIICACVFVFACICVYVCLSVSMRALVCSDLRGMNTQCAPCGVQCRVTNQAISFIIIRSGLPHRTLLTRPHYKHYIILIVILIFCPASVAFLVGGGKFAIRSWSSKKVTIRAFSLLWSILRLAFLILPLYHILQIPLGKHWNRRKIRGAQ